MRNDALKGKLADARSLAEVREILRGRPELDPEKVFRELQNHRSIQSEKLELAELDAVSGGADRDWVKDGCAATCEVGSWCGSNDFCIYWDVTYANFWTTCPDGHEHVFVDNTCTRCGFVQGGSYLPPE